MNTRCYKCGWNFALSREVVEGAVAAAPNEKFYVAYCPRCRQANKIPMQQLKRTLPVGWTPPAPVDTPALAVVAAPAPEPPPAPVAEAAPVAKTGRKRGTKTAAAEPAPTPARVAEAEAAPAAKTPRKRASKTTDATPTPDVAPTPVATPAAKKASRSKAKPS